MICGKKVNPDEYFMKRRVIHQTHSGIFPENYSFKTHIGWLPKSAPDPSSMEKSDVWAKK